MSRLEEILQRYEARKQIALQAYTDEVREATAQYRKEKKEIVEQIRKEKKDRAHQIKFLEWALKNPVSEESTAATLARLKELKGE